MAVLRPQLVRIAPLTYVVADPTPLVVRHILHRLAPARLTNFPVTNDASPARAQHGHVPCRNMYVKIRAKVYAGIRYPFSFSKYLSSLKY